MLLSRRRQGACVAVLWNESLTRYECGMITEPQRWLPLRWTWGQRLLSRLSRRWIAAGIGCDCDIELGTDATRSSDS